MPSRANDKIKYKQTVTKPEAVLYKTLKPHCLILVMIDWGWGVFGLFVREFDWGWEVFGSFV